MKLSPIENKNKNKTRKETKTHNTGFVWGLLVLGDLSASPQSPKNADITSSLFTKASVMVWVRTVSHKHRHLNTWSPAGDAGPGAFRYSLPGGSTSLGVGSENVPHKPPPVLFLLHACIWGREPPASCFHCLARPAASCHASTEMGTHTSGPIRQNKLTPPTAAGVSGVLPHNRKVTKL